MIVLSRIDSRLIHGQVIEAWLPHLKVERLVVADDAAAADPMLSAAMKLAVPAQVAVTFSRVADLDFPALARDAVRTLVLFRDVAAAVAASKRGLPQGTLNLGNVHAGPGRAEVSRSVFLSDDERAALAALAGSGQTVVIQAVPSEKPLPLGA